MVKIGNFGEAASNYFDNTDSFVNIAYGAARSGKTIVVTFRFFEYDLFNKCNKSV